LPELHPWAIKVFTSSMPGVVVPLLPTDRRVLRLTIHTSCKGTVASRVVIISIFSDHDPDTDRTITIVDRDLDQNKKLRSVSRSIMKFSVNLYRSRANYHWLKVLALKKL
jgi:hypothetical protein